LGLFVQDDESPRKDYAALIQKFNRWLTHTVSAEDAFQPTGIILDRDVLEAANTASDLPPSHIDQVLELSGSTQITCGACGKSFWKPFSAHVVDLIYPRKVFTGRVFLVYFG
jgi:PAB-dependent poly(A)-specific ribonuclease subunit 2